jgi:hypothetical protein
MLQKRKSTKSVIRYAIITPILLLCIGFSSLAQENLPKDEQALLELYKKEALQELEKNDQNKKAFKNIFDFEENENGTLTKNGFYKLKAICELVDEKYSDKYRVFGDKLYEDYQSYLDNPRRTNFLAIIAVEGESDLAKTKSNKVLVNNFDSDVPFASIQRAPIFPGCDESMSGEDLKKCFTEKISQHVSDNFDTKKAKQFGVEGINRVYVRFKITDEGNITDVIARSSHPKLSNEGENAMQNLPKMKPGMHKGEAVNVIYTLPITFTVPEVENDEKK